MIKLKRQDGWWVVKVDNNPWLRTVATDTLPFEKIQNFYKDLFPKHSIVHWSINLYMEALGGQII